jgi:hypothetical protein
MANPQWEDTADPEDVYGGIGGEAAAVGAGAARSATFGLSDQALVRSGLVNPETLKGLQEQNPIASGIGEVAGIVAPMAAGDVGGLANLPGAVARMGGVASGKAASLGAGKIASKALGYGLEGAAYGAGQSVSENALGDHDLVSEKTLANIGLSSAFMGGIGALAGKFGRAVDASSVEDKFAAQKLENNAPPGSPEAVISQTDLPAEDKLAFIRNFKSQKPGANALRKEFSEAGLPEVLGMMSDNQMVQKYASAISQLPTMAGEAVRKDVDLGFNTVNSIIKDSFNIAPAEMMDRESGGLNVKELIRNKFDQMMAPLKDMYAQREALGKGIDISDEVSYKTYEDLIEQSQKFRNVTNPGRKVIEAAANDFLKEASSEGGMANLDAYTKQLASNARQAMRTGDYDMAHAFYQVRDTVDKFIDAHLEGLGKQLEKEGIEGASVEANKAVSEYKQLKASYAKFKDIMSDFAETTGLGRKATTNLGLNEALDKIPNEQIVDKIFDPKNAKGLNAIKENFPDVFAALSAQKKSQMYQDAIINKTFNPLQLLKQINTDKKMSKGVRDLLFTPEQLNKMGTAEKWVKNLPAKVGPSGTPEGLEYLEMAKNPVKSLIGHSVNEAGSAVGKKLIESLTRPEEEAQLKTLLNIDKARVKTTKSITTKVKDIFGSSSRAVTAKAVSKLTSANFNDETEKIREDAANPHSMMDKYASVGAVDTHAPQISQSMKMAYIRGIQFLNAKLPPQSTDMFGKKSEPSETEVSKFNRYYNIVQDPVSSLDQINNKTIVPETVETMNAVYPKLYGEMKQHLMDQATKQTSIPFQTKQAISTFLGEPLDSALSPQAILANQMTIALAPKPGQIGQQQMQAKTRAKGLDHMKAANRVTNKYSSVEA